MNKWTFTKTNDINDILINVGQLRRGFNQINLADFCLSFTINKTTTLEEIINFKGTKNG